MYLDRLVDRLDPMDLVGLGDLEGLGDLVEHRYPVGLMCQLLLGLLEVLVDRWGLEVQLGMLCMALACWRCKARSVGRREHRDYRVYPVYPVCLVYRMVLAVQEVPEGNNRRKSLPAVVGR